MSNDPDDLLPLPKDWDRLENVCADLFAAEWADPYALRFGRQGQNQYGVDILGTDRKRGDIKVAVQCKLFESREPPGEADLDEIVEKVKTFTMWELQEFVIAHTGVSDTDWSVEEQRLQKAWSAIPGRRPLTIKIMDWRELCRRLHDHRHVAQKYFGPSPGITKSVADVLSRLYDARFDNTLLALPAIGHAVCKSLDENHVTTLHIIGGGVGQYWSALEAALVASWRQRHPLILHVSMANTRCREISCLKTRWPNRQKAYKDALKYLIARWPDQPLTVRHYYYRQPPRQMGILINGKTLFVEDYGPLHGKNLAERRRIYRQLDRNKCFRYDDHNPNGETAITRFEELFKLGIPRPRENINRKGRD